MKVIVAGSRSIEDYNIVMDAIAESSFPLTEIVSGHAKGVDALGEKYAKENRIPLKIFEAKWRMLGKRAGYQRNIDMARYADALVAIWDGKSAGTKNMINIAKGYGLKIYVKELNGTESGKTNQTT